MLETPNAAAVLQMRFCSKLALEQAYDVLLPVGRGLRGGSALHSTVCKME